MELIFSKHNNKFSIDIKKVGLISKGFGLMFRSKSTENLLFDFGKEVSISITSVFVFFPFLAIWLDGKNKIIESRLVRPFELSIKPKQPFRKIIEIPLNSKNKELIELLVDKRKI